MTETGSIAQSLTALVHLLALLLDAPGTWAIQGTTLELSELL